MPYYLGADQWASKWFDGNHAMRLTRSLRGRLFAGIIAVGLLPLVGLSVLMVAATQSAFRAVMLEHARTVGESAHVVAAERAQRLLSYAEVIAADPALRDAVLQRDGEGLLALLQIRQQALGGPTLTVADQDANVLARAYAPGQLGAVTTKGSQRARQGTALSSIEEGLVRGLAIRGFAPIVSDGRVIGIVVVTQNIDQEFIVSLRQAVGMETFVVLHDGTAAGAALDPAAAGAILAGGETFSGLGLVGGHSKALFARALRDPDGQVVGYLGSAQPLSDVEVLLTAFYRTTATGGLLALLASASLAWLLSRWLIRPVERLAAAARRLQTGESGEIPLLNTGDEIGELSRSLRSMVGALTDQTRAVEELNQRLREAGEIVLSTDDAIVGLTPGGTITSWNPGAERLYGYAAPEVLGRPATMLAPPGRADEISRIVERVHRGTRIDQQEAVRVRRDGRPVDVWLSVSPLRDGAGRVVGIAEIARDVTARKQAEQHLAIQYAVTRVLAEADTLVEAAPELLRTLGERLHWTAGVLWVAGDEEGSSGPAGVLHCIDCWHVSGLAHIAPFEAACRELTFSSGDDLPGRVYASARPIWVRDVIADGSFLRAQSAAQAGLHAAVGFPVSRGDRVLGVLELFSAEIRPPEAALFELMAAAAEQIGQFIERTRVRAERTHLAQRVEQERATLAAVTASMSDGLVVFGTDRRVRYVNDRAAHLVGLDSEKLRDMDPAGVFLALRPLLVDPDGTQADWRRAEHRLTTSGEAPAFEIRVVSPVPRDVQVEMFRVDTRLEPGATDGGSSTWRMAVLLRDVSAERSLVRAKDELVSVVSHELRTPLTSLVGFAELLLVRRIGEAQRRQYLETMLGEGQRLTALINDFLDVQRLESGAQRLRPVACGLAPLVARAVSVLGDDAARPITAEVPADLPLVTADPDAILQVLSNLLGNARKYSPGGGAIRVSAKVRGGMVEVSVADGGLGLPAEAIPRLFEKFYRVDNSDRREISGTGLGLAICRGIVAAHGGRIWAQSPGSGMGSTFTFTLPLAAVDGDVASPAEPLAGQVPASTPAAHRV